MAKKERFSPVTNFQRAALRFAVAFIRDSQQVRHADTGGGDAVLSRGEGVLTADARQVLRLHHSPLK